MELNCTLKDSRQGEIVQSSCYFSFMLQYDSRPATDYVFIAELVAKSAKNGAICSRECRNEYL